MVTGIVNLLITTKLTFYKDIYDLNILHYFNHLAGKIIYARNSEPTLQKIKNILLYLCLYNLKIMQLCDLLAYLSFIYFVYQG